MAFFGAMPATAAPGSIDSHSSVTSYSAQFGTSHAESARRLQLQAKVPQLSVALKKRLGRNFTQAWFDNGDGRWVVAVPSGGDELMVRAVLDEIGLPGTRVVRRSFDHAQLKAAANALADAIKRKIRPGNATSAIQDGRVAVEVSQSISREELQVLRRVGRSADVLVSIEESSRDSLAMGPTACGSRYCSPVAGGVVWGFSQGSGACSTAFVVHAASVPATRYALTAGHCVVYRPNDPWWTCQSGGSGCYPAGTVGPGYLTNGGGDAGLLRLGATPASGGWVDWRTGQVTPAGAVGVPVFGQAVCKHGMWGTSCGTVGGVNASGTRTDGTAYSGMLSLWGVCASPGDSGSALTATTAPHAIGILTNATYAGQCLALAEPISRALTTLGVALSTTAYSGPEFHSFNGDAKADLIAADPANAKFVVATSSGAQLGASGTGSWLTGWGGNPHWADIGDFNGDHKTDLITADPVNARFMVATSNGSQLGASGSGVWLTGWGGDPHWAGVGDFNGDRRDDLIAADPVNARFVVATSDGAQLGAPGSGIWLTGWGGDPHWADVGDFNGDGKDDLIASDPVNNRFSVATSNGTQLGASGSGIWLTGWSGDPTWAGVGDFNGDGKDDLISSDPVERRYAVALSDGAQLGAHGSGIWLTGWNGNPPWGDVADLNGDGKDDLILGDPVYDRFVVALSTGTSLAGAGAWLVGWGSNPVWAAAG